MHFQTLLSFLTGHRFALKSFGDRSVLLVEAIGLLLRLSCNHWARGLSDRSQSPLVLSLSVRWCAQHPYRAICGVWDGSYLGLTMKSIKTARHKHWHERVSLVARAHVM